MSEYSEYQKTTTMVGGTDHEYGGEKYKEKGRGWGGWGAGAIIIIVIIIIIILLIIWWWSCSSRDRDDTLSGSCWQGYGTYAGSRINPNLPNDCHRERLTVTFDDDCKSCPLKATVKFSLGELKYKLKDPLVEGTFDAVGGIDDDGVITLVPRQGVGYLELTPIGLNTVSYRLTGFGTNVLRNENGVSHGRLTRTRDHPVYSKDH